MKTIFFDNTKKILKFKNKLSKELNINISIKNNELSIDGTPENEFIAEKVIEALDFDFPVEVALLIQKDDFLFETLNLKDHTHRKDFESIRARLIGKEGRTLKTLNNLTDCFFELKGNEIGIIGDAERIENAQNAVISLIKGSKQSNVYSFLEKHQVEPILDFGLKEKKKGRRENK